MKKIKIKIEETNVETNEVNEFPELTIYIPCHQTAYIFVKLLQNLIHSFGDILVEEREFWSE